MIRHGNCLGWALAAVMNLLAPHDALDGPRIVTDQVLRHAADPLVALDAHASFQGRWADSRHVGPGGITL